MFTHILRILSCEQKRVEKRENSHQVSLRRVNRAKEGRNDKKITICYFAPMETNKQVRSSHYKCPFFSIFVESIPKILIDISCARVVVKNNFWHIWSLVRFSTYSSRNLKNWHTKTLPFADKKF